MLIDIFARRYEGVRLRDNISDRDGESDRRLLVQAFRILSEDLYPYYVGGKESSTAVAFWTDIEARLSRELGLKELSRKWFTYGTSTQRFALVTVCENWMTALEPATGDEFVKERLSLIELGFRQRESEIAAMNAEPLLQPLKPRVVRLPMEDLADIVRHQRSKTTAAFRASVDELNARFRQAGYALHYHNGFIQSSTDELVQLNVETPFWDLVADLRWVNVDQDMKEALDLRDSDGRDPAFYAARALESAIKIICDLKGWTTGKERGASSYIDHLGAKANAFIDPWEAQSLRDFFSKVRNSLGHGPGSAQMPSLTRPQTEWAIEFGMSWIKSLIRRL